MLADSSSSGLILFLVSLLVALGVAMAIVTVWLVRSTRPDPAVLSRLETMGTARWRRSRAVGQSQTDADSPEGTTSGRSSTKEPTPSGGLERPAFDDDGSPVEDGHPGTSDAGDAQDADASATAGADSD